MKGFVAEIKRYITDDVTNIDFSNRGLTDAHIFSLASFLHKGHRVTSLNLSGNKIINSEWLALGIALSENVHVVKLELDDTGLEEKSLGMMCLKRLVSFNIEYNKREKAEDKDVICLVKLAYISEIILRYNQRDVPPVASRDATPEEKEARKTNIIKDAKELLDKSKGHLDGIYSTVTMEPKEPSIKEMVLKELMMVATKVLLKPDALKKSLKYSAIGAFVNGIVKCNVNIPGSAVNLSCERSFMRAAFALGFSLYSCYKLNDKDVCKELVVASSSIATLVACILPIESSPTKIVAGLGVLSAYITASSCAPSKTRSP